MSSFRTRRSRDPKPSAFFTQSQRRWVGAIRGARPSGAFASLRLRAAYAFVFAILQTQPGSALRAAPE
jgi:hypothetical protein